MNQDNLLTFLEAMLLAQNGDNPSKAIENQERRGQVKVVCNQRLPKKGDRCDTQNDIEALKIQYESLGIQIVSEHDDLFWNVKLPDGWEIKATDHPMWNELLDNKGRKRATFFFKAAFYDRDAFIRFTTRFKVSVDHIAPMDAPYEEWKMSDYQGTVKDGDVIIYCTECIPVTGNYSKDDKIADKLQKMLEDFMQEHYPDYKNINAYWED